MIIILASCTPVIQRYMSDLRYASTMLIMNLWKSLFIPTLPLNMVTTPILKTWNPHATSLQKRGNRRKECFGLTHWGSLSAVIFNKACPIPNPGWAVLPRKISEIVACPQLHRLAISCWVKPFSFKFSMIFFQSIKSIYRYSVFYASGFPIFEFNRL